VLCQSAAISASNEALELPRLPTAEEMAALVIEVEARIKEDPTSMREALRQSLDQGRLHMEPLPDQSYRAHSLLFPLQLSWRMRMRKPRSDRSGGALLGKVSCAGALRTLEHDQRSGPRPEASIRGVDPIASGDGPVRVL